MLSGSSVWGTMLVLSCALKLSLTQDEHMNNALRLMSETPLIDGHNDLPWQLRMKFNNQLNTGRGLNTLRMHCIFTFLFIFNLDHFDHIKTVAGHSIIGFRGDYEGVGRDQEGLEDVSKCPALVAELLRRGWKEKITGIFNALFGPVQDSLKSTAPDDLPIPYEEVKNDCRTSYGYPVPTHTVLGQFSPSALWPSTNTDSEQPAVLVSISPL
uniref:Dipeptidase n=1 Tax=Hucho hucho TaxID=62062 RepID=A0A4W5QAU8_9TELE